MHRRDWESFSKVHRVMPVLHLGAPPPRTSCARDGRYLRFYGALIIGMFLMYNFWVSLACAIPVGAWGWEGKEGRTQPQRT